MASEGKFRENEQEVMHTYNNLKQQNAVLENLKFLRVKVCKRKIPIVNYNIPTQAVSFNQCHAQ